MKVYKMIILSSFVLVGAQPITAEYNIVETEAKERSRPNPLDIFSLKRKPTVNIQRQESVNKVQKEINTTIQKITPNNIDIADFHPIKKKKKKYKKKTAKKEHATTKSRSKIIYLTFDDGPMKGTENIIRVLKEEGVNATMFFVGSHVEKNRALYNKASSMPNLLIANHTYSHANGKYEAFYNNKQGVVNDINRAQKIIGGKKLLRLAGRNVWRLPNIHKNDYGISKARRLIESPKYNAVAKKGYQIYGWDIEWNSKHTTGNPSYDARQMSNRIEALYKSRNIAKSGKIVLLAHDYMFRGKTRVNKLRKLIHTLRSNGWKFHTIDKYNKSIPKIKKEEKKKRRKSPLDILRAKNINFINKDGNTSIVTAQKGVNLTIQTLVLSDKGLRATSLENTDTAEDESIIKIHF